MLPPSQYSGTRLFGVCPLSSFATSLSSAQRHPWLTHQYTQTLIRQSLIKNSLRSSRTGFHRLVYGTTEAAAGMQTQEMKGIAPRALAVRVSSAENENWV